MKINQFFNQISQINESKRVNKNEMFAFITKHVDLLQEFELQKLYERALVDIIRKETGYYLNERSGHYEVAEFPRETINRLMSYEDTIKRIRELEKQYATSDVSVQQRKILKRLDHIFNQCVYEGNGIFKMFGYYTSFVHLLDLLIYIIKGKVEGNLKAASDINDKYFKDNLINKTTITELENIEVQTFKNGKFKIKGFTKWDSKTKEIFEAYNKVRYNN